MGRLRLTVLGGFQARLDAGPVLRLRTGHSQALLAYLALPPGRAQPRDTLAALLWGHLAQDEARHRLRQALFTLRRSLLPSCPPCLRVDEDTLVLDPTGVEVDAVIFEGLVEEGTPDSLERAATLYRGDLLQGLPAQGPHPSSFEEWLAAERERLRELAFQGLARLFTLQRTTGPPERALATAMRLLSLDPLQEVTHRAVMRLYAQAGRRTAALQQYQVCVGLLRRELQIEPEEETRQLYRDILRRRPILKATGARPSIFAGRPGEPTPPDDVPLVGREGETRRLHLASKTALVGERKVVTVLFCNLVGSTALAERLGPEAMHAFLGRFFELALGEVHRYEGTVNQFLGDGFMALFGAPIAHEDHARRAVLAALALQRTISERTPTLVECALAPLSVRMGLNTGPVVVGAIGDDLRMDYTAVGDTTNLAARFQQIAEPGAILTGDATVRFLRGEVLVEALGPISIRGKSTPVPTYRVTGTRPRSPLSIVEERTLSPFVGRQRDLRMLGELVDLVENSQGQVLAIVGEPGVGKSRLLHELARRLTSRRLTWLEGRCLSYGAIIPFLPVLDILRAGCGILREDGPAIVDGKLRAGLQDVGIEPTASAPYLLHFLGIKEGAESVAQLPPEAIKPRTFQILREMSVRAAQHRPVVFVVEDLHWIDKSSEEYLTTLVEGLAVVPIFLVTTSRPGYRPPWMDRSFATQVTLRPLSSGESVDLARSVAPGGLSEPVAEMILRKAEGNPFFIEELTRSVLERGAVDVPDTIHAVLAARIDRLPPESKVLLQAAAVLGREFPARMLDAVWENGDPAPHLHELRRRELLYDRVGLDGTIHVFKHALVQDVAYESLLREQRRELHARVLNAIEHIRAERQDEQVDHLARHALRAEIWDKAVAYSQQAGLRATARSAFHEGIQHYREALEAITHLPAGRATIEQAIAIRLLLRTPLWILGRFDDTLAILREVEKAARELGDNGRLRHATMLLWNVFWITGRHEEWRRLLPDLKAAVEAPDDPALQVFATLQLGQLALATGEVASTCGALEASLPVADGLGPRPELGAADPRVVLRALLTGARAYLGKFREGIAAGAEGVEIASGGTAFNQMYIVLWLAWLHAWKGDFGLALPLSDRAVRLIEEHGLSPALPPATATHGWILCGVGRADEGIPLIERALELAESRRLMYWFTNWVALLSEGHLLSGDLGRSQLTAARGLSLARDRREPGIESWMHCLLGDIACAAHSDPDTAKRSYRDAMSLGHPLGLRPLIARGHLGIGKLDLRTGNRKDAEGHLTTATTMYREMGMALWLAQAEAELRKLASPHTQRERSASRA